MLAAMATERASLQLHGGRGRRFVLKTIISLQSCQWVLKEVRRAELAIFPVKFAAFWAWFVLARLCQTVWERPTYFPSPCMSRPLKKKGKELKAFLFRQTLRKGGKDSSSEKGRKGKNIAVFLSGNLADMRETWGRNIDFETYSSNELIWFSIILSLSLSLSYSCLSSPPSYITCKKSTPRQSSCLLAFFFKKIIK